MASDQFWARIIYVVSIVISLVVAFLILGPRPIGMEEQLDVSMLPAVNATLNGITTLLLIFGYVLIRQRKQKMHRNVMLVSFGMSFMFLVTYVIYHWFKSGPKAYMGEFTLIYYSILVTHVILASLIIPMVLFTLYRGLNSQVKRHKKIAKITLPIWLYVSVTGVVIYMMLYY